MSDSASPLRRSGSAGRSQWRRLPPPARPIAAAVAHAVPAAAAGDAAAFGAAVDDLAALDPAQVGLLLGTLVRVLLEDEHPDGIDAADIRRVVADAVHACAVWCPDVDPQMLVLLLAGALGVHDQDAEADPPPPATIARHGALLVAALIGPRPIADCLLAAVREMERAQLHD